MADYQYIATTGTVVPDTADQLAQVQSEYRAAFGADLIVDPETPQGVLITAETAARDAVARNNATLANQINPNLAGGIFLDAILALTGVERTPATRSTISGAALTGIPGTVIPAGSQATTTAGDVWQTLATVTLDGSGNATADFESVKYGPISATAGSLNSITSLVLGWETVTNANAATLGTLKQSDQAARALRRNTLAAQGVALPLAIASALYLVKGVKSLAFRENVTSAPITIDGVTLVAHSIYACVDGGTDADVAAALLANKSLGADWNGTTTVNVTDPSSGQVYPVKFSRPVAVPVKVEVTVRGTAGLSDVIGAVRAAVLAYANGEQDGEAGFVVDGDVSPWEIAGAVSRTYPGLFVQLCRVAPVSTGIWTTDPIAITIAQKATLTSGNVTVILA